MENKNNNKNFLIILTLAGLIVVLLCVFFGNKMGSDEQIQGSNCSEETGICQMPEEPRQ